MTQELPAKAINLGFMALDVVDYEAMKTHYEDIVGLPKVHEDETGAYFACGGGHHALSLHPAHQRGFRHFGLEIAGDDPLEEVAARLRAAGVACEVLADPLPGLKSAIRFIDPNGLTVYLYRNSRTEKARFGTRGITPVKFGHMALFVRSPDESLAFYSQHLGFRWSDWLENRFVFMRCNSDHHAVNLLRSDKPGLFHFAFELRNWNHLGEACDFLARHEIRLICGPGRHGLGGNQYIYHHDPDGNMVEMFTDMDKMTSEDLGHWDPRPHHKEFPQRPKVWPDDAHTGDIWGVPVPAGFIP